MGKNHFLNELHAKAKMLVHPRQSAARITMGYAVVSGLWILFSDRLLPWLSRDPDTMVILSSVKGFLFVLVTSGILFALVYVQMERIQSSQQSYIESAQNVERLAYHDQLTGLPNREKISELLKSELLAAAAANTSGAVLYIDMDDLKLVNDSYGHSYGDSMIITAAMHLVSLAPLGSTVARVGGDEFIVLLPAMDETQRVEKLAAEIVDTLSREYEIRDLQFHASASIGIAMYPQDGRTTEEIFRNADTALNEAKRLGKHCWRFFHKSLQETAYANMRLINGLQSALTNRELSLHFQPQLSLKSGEAIAFEALLRWRSGLHGDVSPGRFIPLVERSHLIEAIGAWTLREAAVFSRTLISLGHPDVRVAVNVSPRQLKARDFLQVVRDSFTEQELAAGRLEIEITEHSCNG